MDSFNLPPKPASPAPTPGPVARPPAAGAAGAPPAPPPGGARGTGPLRIGADQAQFGPPPGLPADQSMPAADDVLPWDLPEAEAPAAGGKPFAGALGAEAGRAGMAPETPVQPTVRRTTLTALPSSGAGPVAPGPRPPTGGTGPLAELRASRPELADAVAAHLLDPDGICQLPGKATCVAATVQKTLARSHPELYAMMVKGLAGSGVRLPNGQWVQASPANVKWIDMQGLKGKARVDALMQAALMDLGAPGKNYQLADDRFAGEPGKPPGLSLDQARRLIEGLLRAPVLDPRDLKAKWDAHHKALGLTPPNDPLDGQPTLELANKLLEGVAPGSFAAVRARDNNGQLLRGEDGKPLVEDPEDEEDEERRRKRLQKRSHMVQIIAVDEKANTVTYIDALGAQRTIPSTTFARIMLMTSRASELEGIGSPAGVAVAVQDVVVEYPGLRALDHVSFQIPAGAVTALVGPNGAGKTTLMRCLVALERPFSGTVAVDGLDTQASPREVHRRVGYLSDNFGLYDELSVARCLEFAATSHGLKGPELRDRVATLIEQVGLTPLLERRAGTLSRGERQRVGLAQALVHDPPLLVLDEPASGLDPGARHDLSALLKRLRDAGKTILVSSHILAELEDYSNWMLTLDHGRVLGMVEVAGASPGARWLRIRVAGDLAAAREAALGVPGVQAAQVDGPALAIAWTRDEEAQADLVAHLVGRGVRVFGLEAASPRMQEVYLAQVGGAPAVKREP